MGFWWILIKNDSYLGIRYVLQLKKWKMKRCLMFNEQKKLGWTNQSTAEISTTKKCRLCVIRPSCDFSSAMQPRDHTPVSCNLKNQSHPSMTWSGSNCVRSLRLKKKNALNLGSQSDLRAWHLGSLNSKYRGWLTPMNCMEMTWNS